MTYEEMQAASTKRAESIIGAWNKTPTGMTKVSIDAYKQAYQEIDKELQKITLLLDGIPEADRMNALRKYDRLKKLKKEVKLIYNNAAKINAANQVNMSSTAMTNKYYADMYATNWFTDSYFNFIDQKAVDVSVLGTPEVWENIKASNTSKYLPYQPQSGTLIDTLTNHRTQDLININRSITQGLIQGKSYQSVSKDIKKILNSSANNAVRIARTEGNRNLNSGSYANTQAAVAEGIELKRRYIATLDTRTRQQSGSMDGQEVNPDEPFTYPNGLTSFIVGNSGNPAYDINDRCTSIDIIPGLEPEIRSGLNPSTGEREIASYKDFDVWMKDNDLKFNRSGKIVPV